VAYIDRSVTLLACDFVDAFKRNFEVPVYVVREALERRDVEAVDAFSSSSRLLLTNSSLMMDEKEASVFPLPVGEATSTFSRSCISGTASFCGGVKKPSLISMYSPNSSTHHSRRDGSNSSRTSRSSARSAASVEFATDSPVSVDGSEIVSPW